jgi:phosphohistidine phosphatase SixA
MRNRRALLAAACAIVQCLGAVLASPVAAQGPAGDGDWHEVRAAAVVLFRHANAPGVGDPQGMKIGDCKTQRNLDDEGRAQARRIGATFRERAIEVGAVLTSRWCRARDTAAAAFPGRVRDEPAFDSFFADRGEEPQRTADARRVIDAWRGPGVLVVVTHQVNIAAITGRVVRSGEGVVLRRQGKAMVVVGSVVP